MKPIFSLVLGTTLLGALPVFAQNASHFQVRGTQILAPNGQPFVPVGANVGLWVDNTRAADVDAIKNLWKFNTVRVFLKLQKPTKEQTPSDELLDRYVNAFTGDHNGPKTVVIFEFHDKSGGYYREGETPSLSELREAWKRIAARYKDNAYVWFNIMNEPGAAKTVPSEWLDLHQTVLADIRSTGAQNVVICDGHNFASEENGSKATFPSDDQSAILTYGPQILAADPQKNVVFGWHLYTGWNYGPAKIRNFIERVQAKNLALLVGEYAATTGSSLGDYDVTQASGDLLPLTREKGVGRLVWHYWSWDGNALATTRWGGSDGTSISPKDGTRPQNLTWLGELVWDDAHGIAPTKNRLALDRFGWTASASKNSENAILAVDAVGASGWGLTYVQGHPEAPPANAPDWFEVDMGSPQKFDEVVLDTRKGASAFPRDFVVWVSNDGQNWGEPVVRVENNQMAVARARFAPQTARFVRVGASRFGKDWGSDRKMNPTYVSWGIADFQLFTSGQTPPKRVLREEISRAGFVARANKRSGWDAEWEPKALDGADNTRWTGGSGAQNGDEFVVDMQAPQTLAGLEMSVGTSNNSFPRAFEVFTSQNGKEWGEPVAQALGEPVTTVAFQKPVKARWLKIVNRRDMGKEWWAIHELRFFARSEIISD